MSGDLSLVVFDMDGTLIDSQRTIIAAMTRAYERAGAPAPSDEAVRGIIGLSLPEVFATLSPDADPHHMADLYRGAFVELRAETGGEAASPLFPGAAAALAALDGAGRLLSVATGKSRRGLAHATRAHGWEGLFLHPQTADDAASKPNPEMILNILNRTGVDPGNAVMVGDTTFDMAMARAAGVRAVGVAWGYHDAATLPEAGADLVIDGFDELPQAVARLTGEGAVA